MSAPALSGVLCCARSLDDVAMTIRCFAGQDVADRLELVVVAADGIDLTGLAPVAGSLAGVRVVRVDALDNVAAGYAAGVRAASAPVVVMLEDHSYPCPGWASALIERHAGPWAVVGPAIRNANPRCAVSRADFLMGYGRWMDPSASGEATILPGHNSSYKRDVLLALGDRLEPALLSETVLHLELAARGERLYHEARAVTRHVNFGVRRTWLPLTRWHGREFAAARSRTWSPARRALYTAAAPLIALVRLARIVRFLDRAGRRNMRFARTLPILLLGLAADAHGQALGYLRGGPPPQAMPGQEEFCRLDHVSDDDRRDLARLA